LTGVKVVVSTLREMETDVGLVDALRRHGFKGLIAATAHSRHDGKRLRDAGADQVLMPFTDAADHAARRITARLQEKEE
jgi:2-keto-3-deoxy-L-rhamnonate aldolase RhmA